MRKISADELAGILEQHQRWLRNDGGTRAYLKNADLANADLVNINLAWADFAAANLMGANLMGANLVNADFTYANLTQADLSLANLTGANLTGANLTGAVGLPDVPVVADIDAKILAAIEAGGELYMKNWHSCATTHCRAGWAITIAGEAGLELERKTSPYLAGRLIYEASRSGVPCPDFFATDEEAMADLRRCAGVAP